MSPVYLYEKQQIKLFLWTLLYKDWNVSLPDRNGQSLQWLGVLDFSSWWYLQTLFSISSFQAGSQQLCISKFTFSCTCLAFCSLSMTPFRSILPAAVCIFYLSLVFILSILYAHSSHIVYFLPCYFLQTKLNLQYFCSWCFLEDTHIRVC